MCMKLPPTLVEQGDVLALPSAVIGWAADQVWWALFFLSSVVPRLKSLRAAHFSCQNIVSYRQTCDVAQWAWFTCSRRRHAMKRRSELGRVPMYGDDLRKLQARVQVGMLPHILTLFGNFNCLLWRRPRQQTWLSLAA